MSVNYKRFITHAKRVTRSEHISRPVLKGVNHFEDGSAVVTDAHRLYLVKDIHEKGPGVLDPYTNKKIEKSYPDVFRLLPDNFSYNDVFNVDEFLLAADIIALMGRLENSDPTMRFEKNNLTYRGYSREVEATYELSKELPDEYTFHSNAQYWVDALKMFKAFGYTEVTFNFVSAVRPFTLVSPDEKITVLMLPMRSH